MTFLTSRLLLLPAALLALAASGSVAQAQCATCPQPTVAYAPVAAPAPVVYQTNYAYNGWYPGKYLGRLFSRPFRTTANAPVYTANYAYQPALAAAPVSYTAAYTPTYPPSYTVGYAPVLQTVARPVTLAPVASCGCNACCSDPCSCGGTGVVTAGYDQPAGGCPSCAGSPASYDYSYSGQPAAPPREPTPALPPGAPVPEQRVQRPVPPGEQSVIPTTPAPPVSTDADEGGDQASWFEAPQLFNPSDRSAKRPTAPVWTAVYRQQVAPAAASYSTQRPAPRRNQQVGASGWRSASN